MGSALQIFFRQKNKISDLLDTLYKTAISHLTHRKKSTDYYERTLACVWDQMKVGESTKIK